MPISVNLYDISWPSKVGIQAEFCTIIPIKCIYYNILKEHNKFINTFTSDAYKFIIIINLNKKCEYIFYDMK